MTNTTHRNRPNYMATSRLATEKQLDFLGKLRRDRWTDPLPDVYPYNLPNILADYHRESIAQFLPDTPHDATVSEVSAAIGWCKRQPWRGDVQRAVDAMNAAKPRHQQGRTMPPPVRTSDTPPVSSGFRSPDYRNATLAVQRPGAYIEPTSGDMFQVSKVRGKPFLYARRMWVEEVTDQYNNKFATRVVSAVKTTWITLVNSSTLRRMTLAECVSYGHRVNACWDCGEALELEVSQRRGIGPICFGKYTHREQDEHDQLVGNLPAGVTRKRKGVRRYGANANI